VEEMVFVNTDNGDSSAKNVEERVFASTIGGNTNVKNVKDRASVNINE